MRRRMLWTLVFAVGLAMPAGMAEMAAPGTSTGDGAWEWQNPTPCGNWMEATCFVDSLNGWVAGIHGTILRTRDGGQTWRGQTTYTKKGLFGIHFCDLANGWAVGEEGTILHTTNGGATWHAQKSGITAWLHGVHAESSQTAWVVGDGGLILCTQDGGKTWLTDVSGTTASLRHVWWPDPDNGWAVGDEGTVLYRDPSAKTWVPQSSGVMANLGGVSFVDDQWGWAVGDGPTILHTEDGGQNWVQQTVPGGYSLRSVSFADHANGWVVGDWETILWTQDGGQNWHQSECPVGGAYLRSVSGVPGIGPTAPKAWAVGFCGIWDKGVARAEAQQQFNPLPCVIIKTDDVVNWYQQSFGFFWGFSAVDFVNTEKGWAVGPCTVAWTADGGMNWSYAHWLGVEMLEDMDFVDELYGWTCGFGADGGLIWYTPDGGEHWYDQPPGTPYCLTGIYFLDRQRGWACGENGTIFHTENGGETWEEQASGTTIWLKKILFVDDQYGWCVGHDITVPYTGIILATTDGGQHWSPQTVQGIDTPMLESVWFTDRSNGWAVGREWILHTTDGGLTWIGDHQPGEEFFCVRFADARHGWILSGDYVLATANGGCCWVRQELGNQDQMGAACFPTAEQGWIVGGGILHTDSGGFGTCRGMKALSDFHSVKVQNVIVTAVIGTDIYVQQPNRSSGILARGLSAGIDIEEGDVLSSLTGTMSRTADDERCVILDSVEVTASSGELLSPLGMPNRSLGGGDFCFDSSVPGPPPTGQRGVELGSGINNIGLLGRTWGRVIEVDPHEWPEWMIIDDNFMTPQTRVKVIIPSGLVAPDVGKYVVVTGPISCVLDPGTGLLKRALKVRKQEDIQIVQ